MKALLLIALSMVSAIAAAAERKPFDEVNTDALTRETQITEGSDNALDLVWWLPVEFWQVALQSNPSLAQSQIDQVVDTLRPYSVIAVVQADISPFGAFHFFDEAKVASGLQIDYVREGGTAINLPIGTTSDPDLNLLLKQLAPILSAAMGEMGQNFYFFPLADQNADGERIVSPYETGQLRIDLTDREGMPRPAFEIEFPLDSLFVPRLCRNGKPAHISWKYCPWDGKKLK
jgi:hypothetical protein